MPPVSMVSNGPATTPVNVTMATPAIDRTHRAVAAANAFSAMG
jgi:hypothetical protein